MSNDLKVGDNDLNVPAVAGRDYSGVVTLYRCESCDRSFYSVVLGEYALIHGCPDCGGEVADVD